MTLIKLPTVALIPVVLVFTSGCASTVTAPDTICGANRSASTAPITHDPILFVHGYGGNGGNFCAMIDRFRADGWTDRELYAYNYSFIASYAADAEEIRAQVDQILGTTGATKVDIIAHSAGSVSSRYYLKNLGGAAKVDAWVSLGGPNHGTATAFNCSFTPCVEIQPGSAFLAALNTGDETPGSTRYGTWWSPCDETSLPASVLLVGATNHQTACIGHQDFLDNLTVYQQVRDWIR
jgi:triacylglycerol lipase